VAVAAVVQLKRAAIESLLRCEFLNCGGVEAANACFGTSLSVVPTVLLELIDSTPEGSRARRDFERVKSIFMSHGALDVAFLQSGKAMDDVWEARRGCLVAAGMFRNPRKRDKVLNTDVCVPLTELASTVGETEKEFDDRGVPCIICAHVADGNFHCMIPYSSPEEEKVAKDLELRLVRRAIAKGGTASGEHGVGIGKVRHLIAEHGRAHIDIQERIKGALDPLGLMNPGIFYPSEQEKWQTSHL
jgi:D-lactate dehydrogenase (cytochrome)